MFRLTWEKTAKESILKLEGEAVINNIITLHKALQAELAGLLNLRLDLSGLTACDLSFLQLLCAMHQSLLKRNGRLDIAQPPPCFPALATEAGFISSARCDFKEKLPCLFSQPAVTPPKEEIPEEKIGH